MLQNYFKIAWRNLWKNKVFSLINIFGLAIGIAFAMLIGAYVWDELQVNHQLKDADNQYIILSKWKDPNLGNEINSIAELPKALADNYPGLVSNYYHTDLASTNVSKGEKHYRESIQIGDSSLLHMYGFKLLDGDVKTALNDPFSVVITQNAAMKYFGRTNVVGQSISFESMRGDQHDFIISGVLKKIPYNSVTDLNGYSRHLYINSDFFFNIEAATYFKRYMKGWDNTNTVNYVQLRKGADPAAVNKAMANLVHKYEVDEVIPRWCFRL